jgi:hypothetical protein
MSLASLEGSRVEMAMDGSTGRCEVVQGEWEGGAKCTAMHGRRRVQDWVSSSARA